MKIFIQIASYRDPELVPTLRDCIANADNPSNLVFGICRQYHPDDKFDIIPKDLTNKYSFKIEDVPHAESQGVCWARNKIQQMYDGEDYTLQLDSHHRFALGWDTTLIKMIKQLQKAGHKKPLLTGYIPSYDPENDPGGREQNAWEMVFDRFIPEGAVFFLPQTMQGWQKKRKPKKSRFYSAHFSFTLGKFAEEVQHDPDYYFHGEEISIAARAFTHGYDLFHPHKPVVWHEYTRKGRTKCWDDDKEWGDKNASSHLRNRKLFEMDGCKRDIDFGKYGFGTERSLADYEQYAGLCFSKRAITKESMNHDEASLKCKLSREEWEAGLLQRFKHCIDLHKGAVPHDDYDFWCVAFKDKEDNEVYRQDVDEEEVKKFQEEGEEFYKIWREFDFEVHPSKWIIWPHSKSRDWCDQITGNLIGETTL